MKSKVIRLNEIQIKVLKQYLSKCLDCEYNEIVIAILNEIIKKLEG